MTDTLPTPTGTPVVAAAARQRPSGRDRRWWHHPATLVAGLVLVAGVLPLTVALAAMSEPRWYPVSDLAQTELRVQDITRGDPPLVGPAGRMEGLGMQGSHLGPIGLYALLPVYALLGEDPWGLLVSTVVLTVTAMALAVALAHRRGGQLGAVGMATALAVLAHAYGPDKLVEPWNAYLPVMWWVVFLVAVWSLLCDDLVALPIGVVAGTFCVQNHVSYLGLVPGVAAVAVVVLGIRAWQRRSDRDATRRLARWGLPSLGLLALLWLPPLLEMRRAGPGNLSVIRASFTDPPFPALGLGTEALELWLVHLDVRTLATRTVTSVHAAPDGSVVPGLLLLVAWLVAAGASARARQVHPTLWRLHVVVGLAAGLGLVSISRIHGVLYDYVLLWAWGTTTLMAAATVGTLWVLAEPRRRPDPRLAGAALVLVLVVAAGALADDARDAGERSWWSRATPFSRALSPQLEEGLARDGRYLFRWDAAATDLDWSAYGLLVELRRSGFDVGVDARVAVPAGRHRVRDPQDATAAVNYVPEHLIDAWRRLPGAVEVAYFEPRSPVERAEYFGLTARMVDRLRGEGLDDLVPHVDDSLITVSLDPRTPPDVHTMIGRLYELGRPVAVFVAPVEVLPPPVLPR